MTVGTLALRSTISFSTKNTIGYLPPYLLPVSLEASGGGASPACRIPLIEFHVEFVPEAGEAAGPPIVPAKFLRFVRPRDNYAIRLNSRRSPLEGRRPRRLVAPPDINHIETVVPVGTGAPPRLATGETGRCPSN